MKPYVKAILFLVLLFVFDFLTRKGLLGFFLPFSLPNNLNILLLFTVFAVGAWFITKRFAKSDQLSLNDLGISWSRKNGSEFFWGFLIGFFLWGLVSLSQTVLAGFSWELRPGFNALTLIHGLLFIFIADLGTELYTRGYPLTKFKESWGAKVAMVVMVFFVSLKSISFDVEGIALFYTILIPALHTVFFSFIYFRTKRLGASLGIHTGANFVTISVFDLRIEDPTQAIPAGIFQAGADLENLSFHALQIPYVAMAAALSVASYLWWLKGERTKAE